MSAINRDRPEEFFAYLETAAQHAAYTIRDYRRKSRELVLADYPEPERQRLAQAYAVHANAPDGADVFAAFAKERGWVERLRRDMSGIDHVDQQGDRATVQTVRGTRYPFRRRENGIWGLTIFTAELVSEAEKAARDHSVVEKSAADYRRARASRWAARTSGGRAPSLDVGIALARGQPLLDRQLLLAPARHGAAEGVPAALPTRGHVA